LPELTPAQVYDAFSFYYDHQEEIEKELELNREENWKEGLRYPGLSLYNIKITL